MAKEISVEGKKIGRNNPCFIIAEIGINHNGSMELAKKMIDVAAEAGCDAAKFQAFTAKTLYPKSAGTLDWQDKDGKKYSYPIYDNVKSFEMPYSWIPELKKYCEDKGMIFFASISDEESGDIFEKYGVQLLKTTSYAITHIPLLEHLAKKNIPLIISTGGSTLDEVRQAYNAVRKYHDKIIILHCVIKYPAPLPSINMNVLDTLRKEFPEAIIGYSDHSAEPIDAPVAAIYKGADVIEKHITLDKKMKGPDHFFAVEPDELKEMVMAVRDAEAKMKAGEADKISFNHVVLGTAEKKCVKEEEYLRKFAREFIFAAKPIKKGAVIKKSDLMVLRPGKKVRGLAPKELFKITGGNYAAARNIAKEDSITWKLIKRIGKKNSKKSIKTKKTYKPRKR
ncbi:N-acetylneuraminate synthase family protein [Candidatus Woesearchaeota archaeon]|nr:N-acetylneuraminate synthase family protein [Candidatus Woesearchaeota archaeon]